MSRRRQRWSIQVDEYPAKGQKMYGPQTIVSSWGRGDTDDYATNIGVPNTELDEIFIDGWFHLEGMSTNQYWMRIGGLTVNVQVDGKTGQAKMVTWEDVGDGE